MTNYQTGDMADLRLQFGGKCQFCGARQSRIRNRVGPLEFAHLKGLEANGNGRGLNHRYNEIKKHPERFVLACYGCHRKYDRGFLVNAQINPRPAA